MGRETPHGGFPFPHLLKKLAKEYKKKGGIKQFHYSDQYSETLWQQNDLLFKNKIKYNMI